MIDGPRETTDAEQKELESQLRRLRQFFAWDISASFAGIAFVALAYLFLRLSFLPPVVAIVAINTAILIWARRQAVRGDIQRSVVTVCFGLWFVLLGLAYQLPALFSFLCVLAFLPVVLPLPYISGRPLKLVMVATTVVANGVALLSLRPQPDLASIPPMLLPITTMVAIPVIVALVSLVLWQYSSRLNETLQRTRAANQALRESETSLEQKVKQRTRELSEARDEALAATRAKSTFLANMSHELRTPLNAVLGYSEMLQEEAVEQGKPEFVPDLQRIHTAGKHLLALISDVLDLSKIEAGKLDLTLETFTVSELVQEVVELIRPMVKQGVRMNIRCDQSVGAVHSDATKLRQALFNLLSNACKFTEQGAVDLEVARAPMGAGEEGLTFRIKDTGIGMTLDELSRLFQPFSQGNSSTSRRYGGTGLGLVISRRFCQLMGGDITVASEPGKGSTFTLIIPTRVSPERRAPAAASVPAPPRTVEAAAGTILVVDDDEPTRTLLRRFLEKQGYQVCGAADGEEGLRLARELKPDLITLDVMMPRMDGWTVLSLLKREPALADIPVLLLTIVDQKDHALAEGALDLLTKPIDRERLAAVVTRHARRAPHARALLVVDDDPAVRNLLRRMLEKQGWSVAEAENGKVALDQIAERQPDLILLDLLMPTMDGFVFLDELARRQGGNAAPVVVLTAKDLTEEDRGRLGRSVARVFEKTSLSGDGVVKAIGRVFAGAEGGRP